MRMRPRRQIALQTPGRVGYCRAAGARRRSAYTLAELMLLVALAAILVAIFIDIRRRLGSKELMIRAISLSADGERMAAELTDDSLRVWEASNGKSVATLDPGGAQLETVLSPDGKTVAQLVETQGDLRLIVSDVETRKRVCVRNNVGWGVAFSARCKKLAYAGPASRMDIVRFGPSTSTDPKIIDLENPLAPDTVLTSPGSSKLTAYRLFWFDADDETLSQLTPAG